MKKIIQYAVMLSIVMNIFLVSNISHADFIKKFEYFDNMYVNLVQEEIIGVDADVEYKVNNQPRTAKATIYRIHNADGSLNNNYIGRYYRKKKVLHADTSDKNMVVELFSKQHKKVLSTLSVGNNGDITGRKQLRNQESIENTTEEEKKLADEHEDRVREYEEGEESKIITVDRVSSFEQNQKRFLDFVFENVKLIAAFMVLISILVLGFRIVMNTMDPTAKERIQIMAAYKHILTGAIIAVLSLALISIVIGTFESVVATVYEKQAVNMEAVKEDAELRQIEIEMDDKAENAVVKILSGFIDRVIESGRNLLHDVLGGFGYDTVEELIVMRQMDDGVNDEEDQRSLRFLPFEENEWKLYNYAYWMLALAIMPLYMIAIAKIAFTYLLNAGNYQKVAQAKEDVKRYLMSLALILFGPLILQGTLYTFNLMTMLIPINIHGSMLNEIKADNLAARLIGGLWFLLIEARIVGTFIVRKIVITVFFIVTPLIAVIWAISNKFRSAQMWFGDMLANIATQFLYTIVFFIASFAMGMATEENWFWPLLWMSMLRKIVQFFKATLQGPFKYKQGFQEEAIADGFVGKATKQVAKPGRLLATYTSSNMAVALEDKRKKQLKDARLEAIADGKDPDSVDIFEATKLKGPSRGIEIAMGAWKTVSKGQYKKENFSVGIDKKVGLAVQEEEGNQAILKQAKYELSQEGVDEEAETYKNAKAAPGLAKTVNILEQDLKKKEERIRELEDVNGNFGKAGQSVKNLDVINNIDGDLIDEMIQNSGKGPTIKNQKILNKLNKLQEVNPELHKEVIDNVKQESNQKTEELKTKLNRFNEAIKNKEYKSDVISNTTDESSNSNHALAGQFEGINNNNSSNNTTREVKPQMPKAAKPEALKDARRNQGIEKNKPEIDKSEQVNRSRQKIEPSKPEQVNRSRQKIESSKPEKVTRTRDKQAPKHEATRASEMLGELRQKNQNKTTNKAETKKSNTLYDE